MNEPRPIIKLRWTCGPTHDRCTMFTGMSGQTLANIGTVTLRSDDGESARFRKTIRQGIQPEGFEGITESGWERGE